MPYFVNHMCLNLISDYLRSKFINCQILDFIFWSKIAKMIMMLPGVWTFTVGIRHSLLWKWHLSSEWFKWFLDIFYQSHFPSFHPSFHLSRHFLGIVSLIFSKFFWFFWNIIWSLIFAEFVLWWKFKKSAVS